MSVAYQDRLLKTANYLDGLVKDSTSKGKETIVLSFEETEALISLFRLLANEVFNQENPAVDNQLQAALVDRLNSYQLILQQVEVVMQPFAELHTAIKLATRTNG